MNAQGEVPNFRPDSKDLLLAGLTADQKKAVRSSARQLLIVAGAGSGKTEVMARRVAWWAAVEGVSRDSIVAFTFTERAAEEMKFRIRSWFEKVTPSGQEVALGGMYVGTIHGFCLAKLREFWPDSYHNYDILDEGARSAFILRGFNGLLGLRGLQAAIGRTKPSGQYGQYGTLESFVHAYDQLQEHDSFECTLASDDPPFELGAPEQDWCKKAHLVTNTGETEIAQAFALSAARYYAYLRCRRFLDFSTSQSEFIRRLRTDKQVLARLNSEQNHVVVDEFQDINPIQRKLIDFLTSKTGRVTAVGDHRQSIYGFRGAKVDILAEFWARFKKTPDAAVIDLQENFRSTPRIIALANDWAGTITPLRAMSTPPMKHGSLGRVDTHPSHVALVSFGQRNAEARWIAEAIKVLVPTETDGAMHDKKDGSYRGIAYSDVAVLVRSSTDVRVYMQALEDAGVPCIVRAGPDLFSQPEILLFLGALGVTAGYQQFFGVNPKSLPQRIQSVLQCAPEPKVALKAAATAIRRAGLQFDREAEERLLLVSGAIHQRIANGAHLSAKQVSGFRTPSVREFLTSRNELRRVFPQRIFHMLLSEAEVDAWDSGKGRGQTALFHLGALSSLLTGIETPGWTSIKDYPFQIIGLCQYGAEEGRAEEQPLMVQPDAVSISTVHGVKGLEFAAVFLADVCAQRFPSSMARRVPDLPMEGSILQKIDVSSLADNANYDAERRLMYVALTRAERFLFISHSGNRQSVFIKELRDLVADSGGVVSNNSSELLKQLKYAPTEHRRDVRLATSFSDLRYYLECPHDFYLRKVLGFSPTIDQAFGYGRGVHNLMRAVHADPKKWAQLASNPEALKKEIRKLIDRGLFYLRYTVGDPAENMRNHGTDIVAKYIQRYAPELAKLTFEPEKEFETLVEHEDGQGGALISGAIDVVRQDNPPRVTLIDFKSGDAVSDKHQALTQEQMQFQVALYAVAAQKELQYQPEQGLVRYLDSSDPTKAEMRVSLTDESLLMAKTSVARTAAKIRDRQFMAGPAVQTNGKHRCSSCDFIGVCGMKEANAAKKLSPASW